MAMGSLLLVFLVLSTFSSFSNGRMLVSPDFSDSAHQYAASTPPPYGAPIHTSPPTSPSPTLASSPSDEFSPAASPILASPTLASSPSADYSPTASPTLGSQILASYPSDGFTPAASPTSPLNSLPPSHSYASPPAQDSSPSPSADLTPAASPLNSPPESHSYASPPAQASSPSPSPSADFTPDASPPTAPLNSPPESQGYDTPPADAPSPSVLSPTGSPSGGGIIKHHYHHLHWLKIFGEACGGIAFLLLVGLLAYVVYSGGELPQIELTIFRCG